MDVQEGRPIPEGAAPQKPPSDQNRILKLFLFLPEATADTFAQKIPLLDAELEPLNLKVRPGSNWKMRASDGTSTHNDGYGLELLDPLKPVARYMCYRLRHIRLPSGALAKLALSKELISTLQLTPCCQQALDKVEAQPGLCLCARRGSRDVTARDSLKRKREEALAKIKAMRPPRSE